METQETILEDNQIICILTENIKKTTSQEKNIQSIIRMLNEEYGFEIIKEHRNYDARNGIIMGICLDQYGM